MLTLLLLEVEIIVVSDRCSSPANKARHLKITHCLQDDDGSYSARNEGNWDILAWVIWVKPPPPHNGGHWLNSSENKARVVRTGHRLQDDPGSCSAKKN